MIFGVSRDAIAVLLRLGNEYDVSSITWTIQKQLFKTLEYPADPKVRTNHKIAACFTVPCCIPRTGHNM